MALDSNDYKNPESTLDGALFKPNFINKIKELYADASLLDIGCGGGGLVYNALFAGITAYGIDGSDYNKKRGLGYWAVDEGNLLTCDATKPFYFTNDNDDIHHFTIISSYECLEHIPEHSVNKFLLNIYNNLSNDGFFIGSISKMPYFNEKTGIIYHITRKDDKWWKEQFQHAKLTMIDIDNSPFSPENFSRGIGFDYQDTHTNYIKNPHDGLLFVAKKG